MIKEETIVEFQNALKEEYGRDVSLKDARDILIGLVGYYDTLAKIAHEMQQ